MAEMGAAHRASRATSAIRRASRPGGSEEARMSTHRTGAGAWAACCEGTRPQSRVAAHRCRRRYAWTAILATYLAIAAELAAGQMEKIHEGGTAKWYDSFDGHRLSSSFPGDTFCAGRKLQGFGRDKCEVTHGCCFIPPVSAMFPETEKCVACQDVRGTWQGVLGTCVYKDIQTEVSFDTATNVGSKPVTVTRCVPTVVDPSLLIFREKDGKMATGVSPSSAANNGGRFAFDFTYSRNETGGELDILVATFLGSRIIFGKYRVEESELGSNLYLALGATRAPNPQPQKSSAIAPAEMMYIFFEGFRIDEFTPGVDTYAARRLPAGSCKHVVTNGEDMDTISRRYMLTWQEIYAFNSHLYEPDNLHPGDILSVGRHHEVKGPCINYHRRQNGPNVGDDVTDYTCTCTSTFDCLAAKGQQRGETLFAVATRYGTSWQRIVDMNPKLFENCDQDNCVVTPGDHLCVVPYLRNVMCETEYREFPVLDNNGNSPGYLETFFSCNPKWSAKLSIDKCCQVPRCRCCTSDGYSGMGKEYNSWNSAPTANKCDVTAMPHAKCLQDPLIPKTTAPDSPMMYNLLCDDDCQYMCDSEDPTVPDPKCPLRVGMNQYTGLCKEKRMLNGDVKRICT